METLSGRSIPSGFADAVYVLHAFQKKSKKGIATPRHDIELVAARVRAGADSRTRALQEGRYLRWTPRHPSIP